MGQQQLLLLVLATVIVGIAIAAGILAFRENSVRSNHDAMTQDAIRIANDLQAWKQKPQMFGGSDDGTKMDATDFAGATFAGLGYTNLQDGGNCYRTRNGLFDFDPDAVPAVIRGGNEPFGNYVEINVSGVSDIDISNVLSASVRGNVGADGTPDVNVTTLVTDCTFPTAQASN